MVLKKLSNKVFAVTLLELLVVGGIISLSIIFFFSLMAQNQKLARLTRDYSLAAQSASNELHYYYSLDYNKIKVGQNLPFTTSEEILSKLPFGKGSVDIKEKEKDVLKEISIKVKWGDEKRGFREIEVATLVNNMK